MAFHDWVKTAWTDLLHWFGVEEQKLASFMYPIYQDAKQVVEKDLLKDIIDGVPVVASALSGGYGAALTAAEEFIVPLLTAQGITLAKETLATLSNALVGQAQKSLSALPAPDNNNTPTPAAAA